MKTVEIITAVKNPEAIKRIREAKAQKYRIQELLAKGVHPSQIPDTFRIKIN